MDKKLVRCPDCDHVFFSEKETGIQCGNVLKSGKVCGRRFDQKEGLVQIK